MKKIIESLGAAKAIGFGTLFLVVFIFLLFLLIANIIYVSSGYSESSRGGLFRVMFSAEAKTEFKTYRMLEKLKFPYIIPDVYLIDRKRRRKVGVDIVAIHETGIYVFCVLKYRGNIYGDMREEKWREVSQNKKKTFENPLLTNRAQVKVVRQILGERYAPYCKGFCVFPNEANLAKLKISRRVPVFNQERVRTEIGRMKGKSEKVLKKSDMEKIYSTLWGYAEE